jgi:hypothetical protein
MPIPPFERLNHPLDWFFMAQTRACERAQEFAKEQQNLTLATPARVPTVNQKPDDKYKAK